MANKTTIAGVGINNSTYVTTRSGCKPCPYYQKWRDMITRCFSDKFKIKHPTYRDCECCPDWIYFMNFRSWMETQDWKGKHLDKDLLIKGNKIYSPDTCVFIEQGLNKFLLDNKKFESGKLMKGVKYKKESGKYKAECNNPFGNNYIGTFDTEKEASNAYLQKKREIATLWANKQTDERVANALLLMFSDVCQ